MTRKKTIEVLFRDTDFSILRLTVLRVMTSPLGKFECIIAVDKSGSMDEPVAKGAGVTRWKATKETLMSIASKLPQIDPTGFDLVLFGDRSISTTEGITDPSVVGAIFDSEEPWMGTPMHLALQYVADRFVALKGSDAPRFFTFVITDGVPNDQKAVIREIKRVADHMKANGMPDEQCTFLFLQVGEDPEGTKYLRLLDDEIASVCSGYDLVDTKAVTEIQGGIAKLIMDAITG